MATTFKTLNAKDVISTRNLLHEAIPVTGQIVSGTYADENIKNFSHGIFQSVYDYPYLSSSANHIFDLTAGYAAGSSCLPLVTLRMIKRSIFIIRWVKYWSGLMRTMMLDNLMKTVT